jgi:hypothetical protein
MATDYEVFLSNFLLAKMNYDIHKALALIVHLIFSFSVALAASHLQGKTLEEIYLKWYCVYLFCISISWNILVPWMNFGLVLWTWNSIDVAFSCAMCRLETSWLFLNLFHTVHPWFWVNFMFRVVKMPNELTCIWNSRCWHVQQSVFLRLLVYSVFQLS